VRADRGLALAPIAALGRQVPRSCQRVGADVERGPRHPDCASELASVLRDLACRGLPAETRRPDRDRFADRGPRRSGSAWALLGLAPPRLGATGVLVRRHPWSRGALLLRLPVG